MSISVTTRTLRQDEKLLAAANHVASIFFPFVGPLAFWAVGLVVSRYVAYHARVALLEAVLFKAATVAVGIVSLVLTLTKVKETIETSGAAFTWDTVWQAALKFVVLWALFFLAEFVTAVRSLFQARDAYRGKVNRKTAERFGNRYGLELRGG